MEEGEDKLVWMQRRKGAEWHASKRLEKCSEREESGTQPEEPESAARERKSSVPTERKSTAREGGS